MHFNGLKLSGAFEEFSITSRFLGLKKSKINFLKKKKRFDCSFYRFEVQVFTNPSSRLEKTLKYLIFGL